MDGFAAEVRTICSLAAALVFAASGLAKATSLKRFRTSLRKTYGLPTSAATVLAPIVPVAELAVAVVLVFGQTRPVGLLVGSGLALAFLGFASVAIAQGRRGDCGCLGSWREEQLGISTVFRSAALLLIIIVALIAGA